MFKPVKPSTGLTTTLSTGTKLTVLKCYETDTQEKAWVITLHNGKETLHFGVSNEAMLEIFDAVEELS